MRIASFIANGKPLWGPVTDEGLIDATTLAPTLRRFIADHGAIAGLESLKGPRYKTDEIQLSAPVPNPGKIWCTGLNFEDYRRALGRDLPRVPLIFLKSPSALVGHDAVVGVPQGYGPVYDEWELTAIIGRTLRGVSPAEAREAIFGYTILYDLTMHEIELTSRAHQQWVHNIDGFAPCGPWLVTSDELSDPENLVMRRRVNGQLVVESSTAQMRDKLPDLISFISDFCTLEPGDMVSGGTPPAGPCRAGDRLEGEIEGIGTLCVTLAKRQVNPKWASGFDLSQP